MSLEEEVQQSTEETAEVEEETTTDVAEEAETDGIPEPEPEEDLEQVRKDAKAYKDQKARAEKAERENKQLREAGKVRVPNKDGTALSKEDTARIERAEDRSERAALRSIGITHADDIKYVRDAAKRLGIDVEEAATDEFVANKLERMQAVRKTKDSTPHPTRPSGSARNSKLPDFSKMSNAEFDEWEKKNR